MDFSLIMNTVKGFLSKPTAEWQNIKSQQIDKTTMLTKIFIPLLVVYVVASLISSIVTMAMTPYMLQFLGFGRILINSVVGALLKGVVMFVVVYGGSFILTALAQNFGAKKDDTASLKVMVFSFIISLVASVATIIPFIGWLVYAAGGVYSMVLLFWGMRDVLDTPQDKIVGYYIVTLLILIVAGAILSILVGIIVGLVIGGAIGGSMLR